MLFPFTDFYFVLFVLIIYPSVSVFVSRSLSLPYLDISTFHIWPHLCSENDCFRLRDWWSWKEIRIRIIVLVPAFSDLICNKFCWVNVTVSVASKLISVEKYVWVDVLRCLTPSSARNTSHYIQKNHPDSKSTSSGLDKNGTNMRWA